MDSVRHLMVKMCNKINFNWTSLQVMNLVVETLTKFVWIHNQGSSHVVWVTGLQLIQSYFNKNYHQPLFVVFLESVAHCKRSKLKLRIIFIKWTFLTLHIFVVIWYLPPLNFNDCLKVQRLLSLTLLSLCNMTFEKEAFIHISTQTLLYCKLEYFLKHDSLEKATFFSFTNLITPIQNNF